MGPARAALDEPRAAATSGWKACSDGCWRASLAQSVASQQTILWVRGYVSENNANELYRLSLPAEIA